MIASSRVLRDFLIDGTLNKVGRVLGQHPQFRVTKERRTGRPGVLLEYEPYILDDRMTNPDAAGWEVVPMDRFLSFPIMVIMEHAYTVRNVVRVTANGLGGVHLDKVRVEDDRRLFEQMGTIIADEFHTELSEVVSATRQIARATFVACEPFAAMARARTEL